MEANSRLACIGFNGLEFYDLRQQGLLKVKKVHLPQVRTFDSLAYDCNQRRVLALSREYEGVQRILAFDNDGNQVGSLEAIADEAHIANIFYDPVTKMTVADAGQKGFNYLAQWNENGKFKGYTPLVSIFSAYGRVGSHQLIGLERGEILLDGKMVKSSKIMIPIKQFFHHAGIVYATSALRPERSAGQWCAGPTMAIDVEKGTLTTLPREYVAFAAVGDVLFAGTSSQIFRCGSPEKKWGLGGLQGILGELVDVVAARADDKEVLLLRDARDNSYALACSLDEPMQNLKEHFSAFVVCKQ
jgi:hypothetical protein